MVLEKVLDKEFLYGFLNGLGAASGTIVAYTGFKNGIPILFLGGAGLTILNFYVHYKSHKHDKIKIENYRID